MPLTDIKIRQAKATDKPIKLTDAHGLYLEVKPNGSKLWRYRFRIDGKENLFAIGTYPAVSLLSARQKREAARELVKQGINPSHRRQLDKQQTIDIGRETFKAVAEEWIQKMTPRWTTRHRDQISNNFAEDVYPHIGHLGMRNITARQILDVIQRVEQRGAPTVADNIRQRCSSVFRYAVVTLRADSDPASVVRGSIIRPPVEHSRALDEDELSLLLAALDTYKGQRTASAIQLLCLTFVRTIELVGAKWTEVDFDSREWRIPAERMKKRRVHLVPLSDQALALFQELRKTTGRGEFILPNAYRRREQPTMSRATINMALGYMMPKHSETITGHDFRATAATHLRELGWADELVELQLAHVDKNQTRGAYNHSVHLQRRIQMMQAWADWLDGLRKHQ